MKPYCLVSSRSVVLLLTLALIYGVVNTRLGVFFVFDVLADLGQEAPDFDPLSGPLVITGLHEASELELPRAIEQPSRSDLGFGGG